eukprot:6263834-Amphidinium_carterae.1
MHKEPYKNPTPYFWADIEQQPTFEGGRSLNDKGIVCCKCTMRYVFSAMAWVRNEYDSRRGMVAVVGVEDILTVIPFYYPIENKASERVLTCVREVILWICKPFIERLHQLGVTLTTAPSYQPQSNGMAERVWD